LDKELTQCKDSTCKEHKKEISIQSCSKWLCTHDPEFGQSKTICSLDSVGTVTDFTESIIEINIQIITEIFSLSKKIIIAIKIIIPRMIVIEE
jgi:hypothetical protein